MPGEVRVPSRAWLHDARPRVAGDPLYYAADLEEYAIWSLTHHSLVVDWLERRMRQLEKVYRFCLERELADVYFLVGSELAAPPLVGLETLDEVAGRRFILSPTAGPFDENPSQGLIDNYIAFIEAAADRSV